MMWGNMWSVCDIYIAHLRDARRGPPGNSEEEGPGGYWDRDHALVTLHTAGSSAFVGGARLSTLPTRDLVKEQNSKAPRRPALVRSIARSFGLEGRLSGPGRSTEETRAIKNHHRD